MSAGRAAVAMAAVMVATACAPDTVPAPPVDVSPTPPALRDEQTPPGDAGAPAPQADSGEQQAPATAAPSPDERPALPDAVDVARADSWQELAAMVVDAERAVREPAVRGRRLARAAHAQQRAYRVLANRPRWRRQVIRAAPADLREAVRRNAGAATELAALVTPQERLPAWQIVQPAPARQLLRHYRSAAAEFGIQWPYLAAINLVETRMGRIRGTSPAGAQGPMQFMPATWDAYGEGDVHDDGDAIRAAARYLAAHGAPEDMRRAVWHYNHSDAYVEAIAAYADVMRSDERAFRGYYHWQVYYVTTDGDVHLPVGYRGG